MGWNISEEDIEDQLSWSPEKLVGHERARTIARQLVFPNGKRLDLLVAHPVDDPFGIQLTVVEVKAVRAGTTALLQLIDYVNRMQTCRGWYDEYGQRVIRGVRGILVAPDFSDDVRPLERMMPRISIAPLYFHVEPEHPVDDDWDFVDSGQRRGPHTRDEWDEFRGDLHDSIVATFSAWGRERKKEKRSVSLVRWENNPRAELMSALTNGHG